MTLNLNITDEHLNDTTELRKKMKLFFSLKWGSHCPSRAQKIIKKNASGLKKNWKMI